MDSRRSADAEGSLWVAYVGRHFARKKSEAPAPDLEMLSHLAATAQHAAASARRSADLAGQAESVSWLTLNTHRALAYALCEEAGDSALLAQESAQTATDQVQLVRAAEVHPGSAQDTTFSKD